MAHDKNATCEIVTSRILVIRLHEVLLTYNDRNNPYLAGTLVIFIKLKNILIMHFLRF